MTGSKQSANISDDLTHALDKLPVLTEKKRKVDMHLKVASYIFKQIQERSLDKLQDIEEEIISSGTIKGENKENLIGYLKNNQDFPYADDPFANNLFSDKIRLAIIMILCLKNLDEMDEYVKLLEQTHGHEAEQGTIEKIRKMATKKRVSEYFYDQFRTYQENLSPKMNTVSSSRALPLALNRCLAKTIK